MLIYFSCKNLLISVLGFFKNFLRYKILMGLPSFIVLFSPLLKCVSSCVLTLEYATIMSASINKIIT